MSTHKQMAMENMEKSGHRGLSSKNPAEDIETGSAVEGLKRKHADMDSLNPIVSQELTCAVEQSPTEPDGVSKLIYVFMFTNSPFIYFVIRDQRLFFLTNTKVFIFMCQIYDMPPSHSSS